MNEHKSEISPVLLSLLGWSVILAGIGLLSLLFGCARTPAEPRADRDQIAAVGLVVSVCPSPEAFRAAAGSAVAIDATHALTALHVVDCRAIPAVRIQFENGGRVAHVARVDRGADVALLVLSVPVGVTPVRIGPPPDLGERACAVTAYPEVGWTCGDVDRRTRAHESDVEWTATVVHGNSGAGVYDARGDLVGIVTRLRYCDPLDASSGSCGGMFTSLESHAAIFGGSL